MICKEPDCQESASVKGLCSYHYGRQWREQTKDNERRKARETKESVEKRRAQRRARYAVAGKPYYEKEKKERPYCFLARKHGVTEEVIESFDTGFCAICGEPCHLNTGRAGAHLDHCHETGIIRGALCRKHNIHIGALEALIRAGLLETALEYLRCSRKANTDE